MIRARTRSMGQQKSDRAFPRSGEFFAPLPLAAVALLVLNDRWLKPTFHSELTGKLSDIAVCFFMPLFVSEVLGLAFGVRPRVRLWAGVALTTALYAGLEVVPAVTHAGLRMLRIVGPYLGIDLPFRMTSDWSDLLCLPLVPLAAVYGARRLRVKARARRSATIQAFTQRMFRGASMTKRGT